ncbi:sodium/calcium exchanger protein-like protein [Westerdykella ornata]|uniref:Sodium/calcium exchanger protein-like protein n=1 Tax=Westerdykella ornata TaxID=318751 RepID=A0A6A6K0P8_WESOR|nr:sodium/calcium exchanger protein-like protein [Westerdykella ornata]KAF2280909.1 sodium/calcium exchanger protein-like protein [Westerdykella ornata]
MDAAYTAGTSKPRQRLRYSARPFLLTLAVIFLLVAASWIRPGKGIKPLPAGHFPSKREVVMVQDEECRLVHHATDKCAFIKANCPDEEAGIFSYLDLYYCRLPHAQPFAFMLLVLWLALLFSTIGIAASDFFCVNLSTIANLLGMSESMAGVTFLAFGNGSPDVFSTFAAMSTNSASLAIGELIGAAGFITAVVAGSMGLVRPFKVARKSFVRDVSFFIVASAFSMGFIADGKLSLWESATMVVFYIFYVCFVVAWHWWLGRQNARRRRAAAIRSHYITPGGEEEEIPQEYHDDEDGTTAGGARSPMGNVSVDDFTALERAGDEGGLEEDDNEEVRERWLGELSSNMRLQRPGLGARRNTHNPIRPSLVGALEFRAVLTSLQKSRNIQSMPINLRRYSDDPNYTLAQQQHVISGSEGPVSRPAYDFRQNSESSPHLSRLAADAHAGNRPRAVSTNDMENTRLDPGALFSGPVPSISLGPASPEDEGQSQPRGHAPPSPTISLSPPPSEHPSRSTSPAPSSLRQPFPDRLAPPSLDGQGLQSLSRGTTLSPLSSPALEASAERIGRPRPRPTVPGASSPPAPFPAYVDQSSSAHSSGPPSLRLPSPSASPESLFPRDHYLDTGDQSRAPRWWPGRVLPPPNIFLGTLFPTLYNWSGKTAWEKLLGIVAAPSVFILTVTLPVVESQKDDTDDVNLVSPTLSLPAALTPKRGSLDSHKRGRLAALSLDSPQDIDARAVKSGSTVHTTGDGSPEIRVLVPTITNDDRVAMSPEQLPVGLTPSEPKPWNRWLVIVQVFTAPFFIVLIVWANTELDNPRALVKPTLYSMLVSLVVLALIVGTTSPTRPPRWRTMLCFMGFAVSIAWISTIANEVVGVLKTLGVILDMSDAILGLTIFAVGNSLGDLVADITVARLGFPVMALSACFGGPMLNILLGIGISGCYMTVQGSNKRHHRHPERPIQFKPYHIDVSTTLIISGATLLVTLVGLLVAVPARGWRMDRVIGWGLLALWSASTLTNVIVEVAGLSSKVS